jgi:hypothetical protein
MLLALCHQAAMRAVCSDSLYFDSQGTIRAALKVCCQGASCAGGRSAAYGVARHHPVAAGLVSPSSSKGSVHLVVVQGSSD